MLRTSLTGIFSFLIVLLLMPVGHALMVLNEHLFVHSKYMSAFLIGLLGFGALIGGMLLHRRFALSTLLGLLAAVLVWTGWVEFSFVWVAEKLSVSPLMEQGEVVTKPEYLVMMSSVGVLATMLLFFLFSPNNCKFFVWIQKFLRLESHIRSDKGGSKPTALITFAETIMLMWTFYIMLLLLYDGDIVGDRHPLTFMVACGCLLWSAYLMYKLLHIQKFDYAVRYAVPTTIIFWNVVEILGRWNFFKEIWVHPFEHLYENLFILLLLCGLIAYYVAKNYGRYLPKR